ncbi:MAG: hypothetical protein E7813_01695 [Bradyrhizobium sp.]|uniref:hypothetical protein n=1 Tax=Bradyrhizobium sp. TaxID=376 RepID=UPI0012206E63|nr:hypothetical protein [Bradyrhizobium sp.]THD75196.1 MAG: hypothetical protein E7813_01695 [Bradyrhizobium sp.]
MKAFLVAAMIALLAGSACAQGLVKGQTPGPPAAAPKSRQQIEADRAAERAYKNSLRSIPDQPPVDPWGNARATEAPKAAAKSTSAKPPKAVGTAN